MNSRIPTPPSQHQAASPIHITRTRACELDIGTQNAVTLALLHLRRILRDGENFQLNDILDQVECAQHALLSSAEVRAADLEMQAARQHKPKH
jgi:hypothetical protein